MLFDLAANHFAAMREQMCPMAALHHAATLYGVFEHELAMFLRQHGLERHFERCQKLDEAELVF